jgi:hypothetical protein
MNISLTGGQSSKTWSHPIGMNNENNNNVVYIPEQHINIASLMKQNCGWRGSQTSVTYGPLMFHEIYTPLHTNKFK